MPTLRRPTLGATALLLVLSSSAAGTLVAAQAGLAGTSWQLVRFEGGDDTRLAPDDRSRFTLAFGADGRASVRLDCNRGTGPWSSTPPSGLTFGPMAVTRAACPDPLADRLTRDLASVRSYVLRDGRLFLSLMADGGVYEFEPLGAERLQSPVTSTGPVEYTCKGPAGAETIRATFYQTTPAMVLVTRGGAARVAFQVPAASGARYEGDDVRVWDRGGEAQVIWSNLALTCKAARTP